MGVASMKGSPWRGGPMCRLVVLAAGLMGLAVALWQFDVFGGGDVEPAPASAPAASGFEESRDDEPRSLSVVRLVDLGTGAAAAGVRAELFLEAIGWSSHAQSSVSSADGWLRAESVEPGQRVELSSVARPWRLLPIAPRDSVRVRHVYRVRPVRLRVTTPSGATPSGLRLQLEPPTAWSGELAAPSSGALAGLPSVEQTTASSLGVPWVLGGSLVVAADGHAAQRLVLPADDGVDPWEVVVELQPDQPGGE